MIFFSFLILYDFIAYNFFNVIIKFRFYIMENLIPGFIIFTVLIIFFQFREIEYRNVDKIQEWFKYYIDNKLSDVTINIKNFIQLPNDEISNKDHGLIIDLNNWYSYYCSRFSTSSELNDLFKNYKDLIFDYEEELFFLENFSNLKTRIIDYFQYSKQNDNKNDAQIKPFENLLEILNNYINNLDFNIKSKKERIYQKREKRKSHQTILNLILAPLLFVISIISISLNFII